MKRLLIGILSLAGGIAGILATLKNPVTTSLDTVISSSIKTDEQYLRASVKRLTDQSPPRNWENLSSLNSTADFVKEELENCTSRVSEQQYTARGNEYRNLLASFGPVSGERIIVGAHYDVCGDQPGADDNASGIGVLLGLARLLAKEDSALHHPVDLVAYTLEEPPFFRTSFMGSAKHADSLNNAGVPIRAMICLEMVGYYSDDEGTQEFPLGLLKTIYPTRGNFIAVIGNFGSYSLTREVKKLMLQVSPTDIYSMNAPAIIPGVDFSDHLNFWKHGYPAVMITNTAFYRNSNYHEPTDSLGSLNFTRMADVVKGVFWAITNLE